MVIGVDGWKGKWVAVSLTTESVVGFEQVEVFESLDKISAIEGVDIIGIDVPIGLLESPPRPADQLARKQLGPRRSSVFDPPPAFCLDPKWDQYRVANAEVKKRCSGRGISAQGFALMNHIRSADQVARRDRRVYEVHPELSFQVMKGSHLEYAKKTWNGQQERIALLQDQGIHIPTKLKGILGTIPPDDLLDAAAVAYSSVRIVRGEAQALPNRKGRLERIWF